jgi:hypothetical protein
VLWALLVWNWLAAGRPVPAEQAAGARNGRAVAAA